MLTEWPPPPPPPAHASIKAMVSEMLQHGEVGEFLVRSFTGAGENEFKIAIMVSKGKSVTYLIEPSTDGEVPGFVVRGATAVLPSLPALVAFYAEEARVALGELQLIVPRHVEYAPWVYTKKAGTSDAEAAAEKAKAEEAAAAEKAAAEATAVEKVAAEKAAAAEAAASAAAAEKEAAEAAEATEAEEAAKAAAVAVKVKEEAEAAAAAAAAAVAEAEAAAAVAAEAAAADAAAAAASTFKRVATVKRPLPEDSVAALEKAHAEGEYVRAIQAVVDYFGPNRRASSIHRAGHKVGTHVLSQVKKQKADGDEGGGADGAIAE